MEFCGLCVGRRVLVQEGCPDKCMDCGAIRGEDGWYLGENKWLSGTIRRIPLPALHGRVWAAIAEDTDSDNALCFKVFNQEIEVVFETHFNIDWLKQDERKVDWLAYVIGHSLVQAFDEGVLNNKDKTAKQLSGLKTLLNGVK